MQEFFRKALVALILLLIVDALVACFCIYQSHPSVSLIPKARGGQQWRAATTTDAVLGGTSTIRILDPGQQSLRFDFRVTDAANYPYVAAEMLLEDRQGNAVPADLSRYTTVSFVAKCAPANSLLFGMSTFDASVAKPGEFWTYPSPITFFSCSESGTPVSLDLTRLAIPPWWFGVYKVDPSRQSYRLDQVARFIFAISHHSPHEVDSHVEISEFTLHGRDDRYLVVLAVVVVLGWCVFGVWFFRAQSRALTATVDTRLKKDLTFVAYRHLTVEPFEDKEKAAILRFIASHYADAGLDLDGVAAGTGTNRSKINDVLKAELGMTFNSYLKKLRLTEAARLLTAEAGATVAEIARSVGYANSAYLNKIFKEEYGCSPRQFRNLAARSDIRAEQEPAGR